MKKSKYFYVLMDMMINGKNFQQEDFKPKAVDFHRLSA